MELDLDEALNSQNKCFYNNLSVPLAECLLGKGRKAKGCVFLSESAERFDKTIKQKKIQTFACVDEKGDGAEVRDMSGGVTRGKLIEVADSKRGRNQFKWIDIAWLVSDKKFQGNEFFHELAMSRLVRSHLGDLEVYSRAPHLDSM